MNKIIILDKPPGITSHDACDKVKSILALKKCGHAGTLDPMVTGVLVIATENATKIMPLLNKLDKEYVGEAKLHKPMNRAAVEKVIKKYFLGKIKQTPPKRSRVKRQERERTIHSFKILTFEKRKFTFLVSCEAGTYIRKLIDDLGRKLKCGAHMSKLKRTKHGPFTEKHMISIKNLKKTSKKIITLEQTIKLLKTKTLKLTNKQVADIKIGRFLDIKTDCEDLMVALNNKSKVIALVKKRDNQIKPERII